MAKPVFSFLVEGCGPTRPPIFPNPNAGRGKLPGYRKTSPDQSKLKPIEIRDSIGAVKERSALRGTEDIGADDFRYCDDKSGVVGSTTVQRFIGTRGRQTNQTDGVATAARHSSFTAMMLTARAGAARHLALLGGKLATVCRGRERQSVNFRLSDQRQDHGAD